jgi:hypothetical protein
MYRDRLNKGVLVHWPPLLCRPLLFHEDVEWKFVEESLLLVRPVDDGRLDSIMIIFEYYILFYQTLTG